MVHFIPLAVVWSVIHVRAGPANLKKIEKKPFLFPHSPFLLFWFLLSEKCSIVEHVMDVCFVDVFIVVQKDFLIVLSVRR